MPMTSTKTAPELSNAASALSQADTRVSRPRRAPDQEDAVKIRPKAKRKLCAECGRLRGRLHIEWHPGTQEWQCSDDAEKCSALFHQRWASGHR